MKLSIIMVSLISNDFRKKIAERAIKHLIDYSKNFEFIYIDNSLKEYELEDKSNIDIYIKNKENIGITAAFNQGYKLSSGDIILFVDNDIDIKKDWQENAFKKLEKYDAVSLIEVKDFDKFQNNEINITEDKFPFYHDSCWLIKRKVFKKIGLLDEKIFCYNEGLDFFIRMCNEGLKSAVISNVFHWHLHSELPYIKIEIKEKDIKYVKQKWGIFSNTEGINLAIKNYAKNRQEKDNRI